MPLAYFLQQDVVRLKRRRMRDIQSIKPYGETGGLRLYVSPVSRDPRWVIIIQVRVYRL